MKTSLLWRGDRGEVESNLPPPARLLLQRRGSVGDSYYPVNYIILVLNYSRWLVSTHLRYIVIRQYKTKLACPLNSTPIHFETNNISFPDTVFKSIFFSIFAAFFSHLL
jgi:hypothetical protein